MRLLEDINSGKYNLVIIVIGLIFIFHIYWTRETKPETMANVSQDIKDAVKQLYLMDVESIRNLSEVATKLQTGGVAVPGNLLMKGPIFTDHDIAHPDTKDGAIYRAEGQFTVAADDLIRFRSSTKKANTIEMNVNDGTLTTNGGLKSNTFISGRDNISVANNTNEGGRLRILNEKKNGKAGQTNDWSIWNMTEAYGNKLAFWRYNGDGVNAGPTLELNDDGLVKVNTSFFVKRNNYIFYPEDAKIYQNIFDALREGAISKSGNPNGWDETSYTERNPWNGLPMIRIGFKNSNPNGAKVKVPQGKNVVWLRILNERPDWNTFQVFDSSGNDLGNYAGGYRKLNHLSPDGGTSDSFWNVHKWVPINLPGPGEYVICPGNKVNNAGFDGWVSGLAFTSNPWNLALNPALSYHWGLNGGDKIDWDTHDWNNDMLARIPQGRSSTLMVPIVPSGKDKLFYIVEHNNNWDGLMHTSVQVENNNVERLRTTWDHPLARHHNSKFYSRFAATIIPENLTRNKRFIAVKIDMSKQNHNIYIREAGTVDLY